MSKSAFFEGGWVTLSADFKGKGASPTNHCWCQKTRVIAVSCGIKIFAVLCLVLSQYTHLTDGQTDGQNSDSNTVRCITCSRTVMIAVSCGIKISAVYHLVLSQYTHLTDRRMDRRTEFRQQYHTLHYMQSHGKNASWLSLHGGSFLLLQKTSIA